VLIFYVFLRNSRPLISAFPCLPQSVLVSHFSWDDATAPQRAPSLSQHI